MEESEELEFKTSFAEEKEIIETLCAFANRRGGSVMVGINDQGDPVKLSIGKNTIEQLTTKIKDRLDPVIYPSIAMKTHGPYEICIISVQESEQKPVFVSGHAMIRVGKANVKLSAAEIREMILKYKQPDFDNRLSEMPLTEFVVSPRVLQIVAEKKKDFDVSDFMKTLRLVVRGKLLNAAYLCFTDKNTHYYHAGVKVGRFKGNNMVTIIDMALLDDGLLAIADQAMAFIRRNIRMGVEFNGHAQRVEKWEYPLDALREAIVNAIVHRDYTHKSQIHIRIFDDRLEICSPGKLPRDLTPEQMIREHRSVPGNIKIAEIFYGCGLIESWGSGLSRILDESKRHGGMNVTMEHVGDSFVVTFRKKQYEYPSDNEIPHTANDVSLVKYKITKPKMPDTTQLSHLNKPQLLVYHTIVANPGLMAKNLSSMLGIPFGSIDRHVRVLLKLGLIIRKGSKKTGGYIAVA